MRVLLTGAKGYLGRPLGRALEAASFDVTRLDAGFFESCLLQEQYAQKGSFLSCADTRDVQLEDLVGHDAIVHLAELSNDPLGEMEESLTVAINQHATTRLAELAKRAGIRRFVYISSCSVYGASDGRLMDESWDTQPLTIYAKSKVAAEENILRLISARFSPVVLRLATAFGSSTALRLDLVVNDFVHSAVTTGVVRTASDGLAWRPFVHVLDVCEVIVAALNAPCRALSGQIINVGSEKNTKQIRDVSQHVARSCGATIQVVSNENDKRSYTVNFSKLRELLGRDLCSRNIGWGIAELQVFLTSHMQELSKRGPEAFRRLESLRYLIQSGRLDQELRWTNSAGKPA
jgi:nucleoside-diphosphate-sugar epimerase